MRPNYRRSNHIYNFRSKLRWNVKDFGLVRFSLNGLLKQSINFVILFLFILVYLIFPYTLCMQLICIHFKHNVYSFRYPFFLKGTDMLKQPFFYSLPIKEKIRRSFLSLRKSFRNLVMIMYYTTKLILKAKHLYKGKLLENLKNSIFPGRLSFLFQNHPT